MIYAEEFEQIDKNSFSYRYPIDKKGKPSTKHHQVVNLCALYNSMQEMLNELARIDFSFDAEKYEAEEKYEKEMNLKEESEDGVI